MDLEQIYAPLEDFRKTRRGDSEPMTVIRLKPGQTVEGDWNADDDSGQMILVLEGEFVAEIGGDRRSVTKDGILVIDAGEKLRLSNEGKEPATAFAVPAPSGRYCPVIS